MANLPVVVLFGLQTLECLEGPTLAVMRRFPHRRNTQRNGCRILAVLLRGGEGGRRRTIVAEGGLLLVLRALANHRTSEDPGQASAYLR